VQSYSIGDIDQRVRDAGWCVERRQKFFRDVSRFVSKHDVARQGKER